MALWAAAEEPHLQIFLVILLNTGARPNAILKVTRFQVDLERRLLNLQPRGEEETNKRNPVLPITDALLPWLEAATGDHAVSWRGKPLDSIKSVWRRARAWAGLAEDATPIRSGTRWQASCEPGAFPNGNARAGSATRRRTGRPRSTHATGPTTCRRPGRLSMRG